MAPIINSQSGSKIKNDSNITFAVSQNISQNQVEEKKVEDNTILLSMNSEVKPSVLKPVKLRFSEIPPSEDNKIIIKENDEDEIVEKETIKSEKPKKKSSNLNKKKKPEEKKNISKKGICKLQEEFYIKLDSEELVLTDEQKILDNLFQINFKRPKGNREFFIKRDLIGLRNIKAIYKDIQIDEEKNNEDLDICPQYGEKIITTDNGNRIWHQLDINAMKLEKRKMTRTHEEVKERTIKMELNGKTCHVGERSLTTRPAIESMDNGRVSVLYHGEYFNLHVFSIEIHKSGKFVHKVNDEIVTVRIDRASKYSSVMFNDVPVENIEADMLLFVPKKVELIIQNNSKIVTSVIKAEISIYSAD